MTLDEQITILEHNAEYERTHGSLQGCLDFRQLAEWLKDYQRLMQRWIPVTERLPEEAGEYLVTISFGNNYHRIIMDFDGEKFVERLIPAFTKCIIAWMPLPEPWKGEEECKS